MSQLHVVILQQYGQQSHKFEFCCIKKGLIPLLHKVISFYLGKKRKKKKSISAPSSVWEYQKSLGLGLYLVLQKPLLLICKSGRNVSFSLIYRCFYAFLTFYYDIITLIQS